MIEQVQEGDFLQVSMPKNDFGLIDQAKEVIFIAGGIGVTLCCPCSDKCTTLGQCMPMRVSTFITARETKKLPHLLKHFKP
jgi:ferredoxin-NADP reductase